MIDSFLFYSMTTRTKKKQIIFLIIEKVTIFAKVINLKLKNKMAYKISDSCAACGTCIDECPQEAISEGPIYKIDPDKCIECGTCADVCPMEAIHLDE